MLELKNICAGYGRTEVLHGLSVSFAEGMLTGIIGANGCGKSTLLKAALGLLPGTRGEVLIDGAPLAGMKRSEIARHLAYLAQGKSVPDMTVEQMVLHGRFPHLHYPRRFSDRDRAIARAAMERVGLGALADKPVAALSGGMRQNAYIAMALAQDTEYILLDEPTTYLDAAHQIGLMGTLHTLAGSGKGIVAVMHDLPLALSVSDRIAVMDGGKIALFGTPEEIFASGITEKLFGVSVTVTAEGHYAYRYPRMG